MVDIPETEKTPVRGVGAWEKGGDWLGFWIYISCFKLALGVVKDVAPRFFWGELTPPFFSPFCLVIRA